MTRRVRVSRIGVTTAEECHPRHRDDWLRLIRRGIDELDRCPTVNGETSRATLSRVPDASRWRGA